MAFPVWNVFFEPFATPVSTRSTIDSTNISVWMPRSRCPIRFFATALGIPPMPSWMHAPSGIISEMILPIAGSSSRTGGGGSSSSGVSFSTMAVTSEMCTQPVPCTRGICGLTSARTIRAFFTADLFRSTLVPRLMYPCASIRETVTMETSTSMNSSTRRGIWWKYAGL